MPALIGPRLCVRTVRVRGADARCRTVHGERRTRRRPSHQGAVRRHVSTSAHCRERTGRPPHTAGNAYTFEVADGQLIPPSVATVHAARRSVAGGGHHRYRYTNGPTCPQTTPHLCALQARNVTAAKCSFLTVSFLKFQSKRKRP